MRICLYSNHFLPLLGGMETIALALAKALVGLGHDVLLVTDTPAEPGHDASFPFRVARLPRHRDWPSLLADREIILSNGPSFRYVDRWIASGLPFGWSHHLGGTRPGSAPNSAARRLKKSVRQWATIDVADYQISVSEFLKTSIGNPRLEVVRNACDIAFRPDPQVRRLEHFLFFGRLVFDKGIDTLVEAAAICRSRGTEVHVLFLGAGPDREALIKMVEQNDLGQLVQVKPGFSGEALIRCVNAARAVVIPSHWGDPCPMVVFEALACGKCVLAARDGGIPETTGENALLFAPGDAKALAELMIQARQDDALVARYERLGLQRAANFTAERMALGYLAIFDRVIRERPNRPFSRRLSLAARRTVLSAAARFIAMRRGGRVPGVDPTCVIGAAVPGGTKGSEAPGEP